MKIERLILGPLEVNTYILSYNDDVIIIDPGYCYERIKEKINNRKVLAILITHSHFDHIGALDNFKNTPIYKFDNLKEKEYIINNFKFEVIFNPGHSSDSVSYYFKKDKCLFCGDFIFYHNIGRCDLPTGNYNEMLKSIDKIKKLDKDVVIYPGHGDITTLNEEINNNYYFRKEV